MQANFSVEDRLRRFATFSESEIRAISSRLAQTSDGKPASKATCARRSEAIRKFLGFAFEFYKGQADLSLTEQSQADRNCLRLCKAIARNMRIAASVGAGSKGSSSLSASEVKIVDSVIMPNSDMNPFVSPVVRFRNYCIFHLVWATGVRRAELVLLELDDISLSGTPTVRIRKPSAAAQRKRRDGASMKTLGREVPISAELAYLLEEYREVWRPVSVVPSRPSPAFFLSERDGRRLSSYSFNKIVAKVGRVPQVQAIRKRIHPHGMRSTAINDIRRRIVESQYGGTDGLTDALAYVGGWTQRSDMVAHYTRAAISERLATAIRSKPARIAEDTDEETG